MNPIFALVFLFAVASAATTEQSKDGQPTKLSDAIIAKYGDQPCLNKVIGQRLVHPTDPHKFLRCMSLEALWIETCPDGLFYNPTMELCDWSSKPRPTTRTNEVVKNRPVLFKTRLTDGGQVQSEVIENADSRRVANDEPVRGVETVREPVREMETTTASLLDELRKKLNLDTTERPSRVVEDEVPQTPRKSLRLLEVPEERSSSKSERSDKLEKSSQSERSEKSSPSERSEKSSPSERSEDEVPESTRRPSLRLIEVTTEEPSTQDQRDFDVQTTSARLFLKSLEKKFKKSDV